MNATQASPHLPEMTPELLRRFGLIVAGLAALIARRFLRMPHLVRLTVPVWSRISRMVGRLAGTLARPARARPERAARRGAAKRASVRLPAGHGWLVRELGYEAAGFGCQLEALLAEPAMQALLAAAPGVARIMRPLCRMLAVPLAAGLVPAVVADATAAVPCLPTARPWPGAGAQSRPMSGTTRPARMPDG